MTIVKPLEFEILKNTARKDETPLWDENNTYKLNDLVQFEGFVYKSATNDDTHEKPNLYTEKWVKFKSINENAFFDDELGTQTLNNEKWELLLRINGAFDTIAFLNMQMLKIKITAKDGKVIYEKDLSYRKSRTWWEYFFGKFKINKDDFVFLDESMNGNLLIEFYPSSLGANLGHLLIGKKEFAGISVYPASSTYLNYSKTSTNEWGITSVFGGKKAKYLEFVVAVEKKNFDYYDELIASLYDTKALFIGDESEQGFKKLTTFGILKDYSAPLEEQEFLQYKLNIQGLI